MKGKIYNIPFSVPFLETIAARFLPKNKTDPFFLADMLFLMPNRRSCVSLKEAFLQLNGFSPFLLPKIVPIQDINEDDLFLNSSENIKDLPSAVSSEERMFLLAKMISSKYQDKSGISHISYTQSLSLAMDLCKLLDEAEAADLSFEYLEQIVPEKYAEHWQETLEFLKIVTAYWPEILKERGVVDPALRRRMLLKRQAENWQKNPPKYKIIAVGLSVATVGIQSILKSVSELENGEIYIEGLDRFLEPEEWNNLSLSHPQYEKKELLDFLKITRDDVSDVEQMRHVEREKMIFEMMRSPETTMKWRMLKDNKELQKGFEGVKLIETQNVYEEAMSIALIMREVLQTPSKTAALVTLDRDLARLVADDLMKYDVQIDDSAGIPLHLTPIGIYLRQTLEVLENNFDFPSLMALLKNPYVRCGLQKDDLKQNTSAFELEVRAPSFDGQKETGETEKIQKLLMPYFEKMRILYNQEKVSFKVLLEEHISLCEKLATEPQLNGSDRVWCQTDGRIAAAVLAKLLNTADIVGDITPIEYNALITMLFARETVHKPYGSHPRLKILGPIEARFNHFDVMIVGSLNEGIWPQTLVSDPFMSRMMKKDFGLPLPERSVGVTANDLCSFMCSDEVYLTRSEKTYGTPTNKSRYILRLETVLQALGMSKKKIETSFYDSLIQKLEMTEEVQACEPSCPRPPKSSRPHSFSASRLKKLMENPYEIYVSVILGLKPLNSFHQMPDMRDFGNLIHKTLEEFSKNYLLKPEDNAKDILFRIFEKELENYSLENQNKIFWRAQFTKLADFVLQKETEHRQNLKTLMTEIHGEMSFEDLFTLSARADRLEESADGIFKIIDYKTGTTPTEKAVFSAYEPQLPLEAMILENGGFKKEGKSISSAKPSDLIYWDLKKNKEVCLLKPSDKETSEEKLDRLMKTTKERISALLMAFENENTPYLYAPHPKHLPKNKDYEHLSRVQEWRGETDGD